MILYGYPFSLRHAEHESLDKRAPITVKFEIPYFTVSGIQVRYLKIVEKSGYQALPWVRYITQNGDDYRCVPILPSVLSRRQRRGISFLMSTSACGRRSRKAARRSCPCKRELGAWSSSVEDCCCHYPRWCVCKYCWRIVQGCIYGTVQTDRRVNVYRDIWVRLGSGKRPSCRKIFVVYALW